MKTKSEQQEEEWTKKTIKTNRKTIKAKQKPKKKIQIQTYQEFMKIA